MSIRIVIADDHQLFIDGIRSILKEEIGITIVDTANNGLELYNIVNESNQIDVVLTDIRMPVMDGIALARLMSKEFPSIPILALSMYNQESDVIEMVNAGAKGYVVKNAGKQEMIEAIYTVAKNKSFYSDELREKINDYLEVSDKPVRKLTKREGEILALVAKGRTSNEISIELNISKFTVDTHRKNIHKKLGIKTNTGLVKYAIEKEKS